jgi:fructosamine-3-kinase
MRPNDSRIPNFGDYEDDWLSFCQGWIYDECRFVRSKGSLSDGACEEMLRSSLACLERVEERALTLVHGDLDAANVLISPLATANRRVTFVGLACAGIGDPAWDLVTLSLYDPGRLELIIDAYQHTPAFAEHVRAVQPVYRMLRLLSRARLTAQRGGDPGRELAIARR